MFTPFLIVLMDSKLPSQMRRIRKNLKVRTGPWYTIFAEFESFQSNKKKRRIILYILQFRITHFENGLRGITIIMMHDYLHKIKQEFLYYVVVCLIG